MDGPRDILSEVSQRQISYDITYMWNLKTKKIQMNLIPKQRDSQNRKQICGYQRENWGGGRDKLGGGD